MQGRGLLLGLVLWVATPSCGGGSDGAGDAMAPATDVTDAADSGGDAPDVASPAPDAPDAMAGEADLGRRCVDERGTPLACGAGLTCTRAGAIGGFACTRACNVDADCPANGLCYIFDRDDGHVCARLCSSDAECAALHPQTRCLSRSSTGARRICVG